MSHPTNTFYGRTRREFLWKAGAGFTALVRIPLQLFGTLP
jgi:hypothetical protein